MRSWSALIVVSGFSLWGCSDESAGSGLGPDTSWQIGCAVSGADDSCSSTEDPHGPVGGTKEDDKSDDQKLKVTSCKKTTGGLQITIEDPGVESDPAKKISGRARSILRIGNGKLDGNRCTVEVSEYPRSGSPSLLRLLESCEGNNSGGTCVLEGEEDSDGYAFNGTVQCDGMKVKGEGPADWKLRAARASNDPVVLQITDCD